MHRALFGAVLVLVLGGACAGRPDTKVAAPVPSPTPSGEESACELVIPDCHAERLPDMTLTGDQTSGALDSVDGFSLDGIISFDQALRRAWDEDGQAAKTVRVVLGSADAPRLHLGAEG